VPAPTAFGALLRRHRRAAGLTHEALAERAGLSVRAISDLERGVARAPRPESLRRLADALGLAPEVRAALATAVPPDAAPPGVPAAPLHNLPAPLSGFVGREPELAAIRARLREPATRLLTLTGPGGVGKTRLALEAAGSAGAFADGVWLVELAPLAAPDLVPAAVAQALRLESNGDRPLPAAIAAFLRDRRLLLVVDNVEHLAAAAAALVAALLRACPGLTVLATGRAPLRVAGEQEFPVPPLRCPAPGTPAPAAAAAEAVRLFVARARAVRPDLDLTAEDVPAVAEVCRRLDGLPLALELAAARVKVLPPRALLEQLGRRVRVLTEGPRDAPARQRTLRATLEWSHALLTPAERALFRHLGAFAGGFSLEAAEAVCAGAAAERPIRPGAPEASGVLAGLAALVDQSLVLPAAASDGDGPRYRLLETVREDAAERPRRAGSTHPTRFRPRPSSGPSRPAGNAWADEAARAVRIGGPAPGHGEPLGSPEIGDPASGPHRQGRWPRRRR
jgi:predicted ATPase